MPPNPLLKTRRFRVPEWNVFFMARFRETKYHRNTSKAVAQALQAFGLELVRADDPNWSASTLWDRVQACLDGCRLGVAVFETAEAADFNPNVSLELGYMMARGHACLLLKDRELPKLPTDLCGHLYKEFDSTNIEGTVFGRVAEWLAELGIRKADGDKVVVFVSHGGTCRCALAKAVARDVFSKSKDEIRFESRAANGPSLATATPAGRQAVRTALGRDWLGEHRPMRAGVAFLYEADLILAMDSEVLATIHRLPEQYPGTDEDRKLVKQEIERKSALITTFFGSSVEIPDPWKDRNRPDAVERYRQVLDQLRSLISEGAGRITARLSVPPPNPAMKQSVAFGDRRLSPWR